MKRFLCLILAAVLILTATACSEEDIEKPVSFYYLRRNTDFSASDSIVTAETVEGIQFSHVAPMIRSYLLGPKDLTLQSPFPKGTYLLDVKMEENIISVTLSDSFAVLSGIDLTLACCALSKTVMEFTGYETVQIQTISALLGGDISVIINSNDIIFNDDHIFNATEDTP